MARSRDDSRRRDGLGVALMWGLLGVVSRLPLRFHLRVFRLVSWFLEKVLHYRRDELMINLSRSFPDKKYKQLKQIRHRAYVHMGDLMAGRLADDKTNLTKDEARELLREGYHPRDVRAAGILGKAANKSARDVLALKKINNGWDDVAKELGLDAGVLREAFRPGWMMGGPGMSPGMGHGPGMRGGEEPIPVPPPMPPKEAE